MDARHFDYLTRAVAAASPRRRLLALLASLPLLGGLLALLGLEEAEARKNRRKTRKKPHKRARRRRKKRKQRKKKQCKAHSRAKTCANRCGVIKNNCKKKIDCGSCVCEGGCDICTTCNDRTGVCDPDPAQVGDACGEAGQVCQSDGQCRCDASSCADGQHCQGAVCICDSSSCSGCCDEAGACQPGTANGACGTGGVVCTSCTGDDTCGGGAPGTPGVCGCTPSTCPAGANCGTIENVCGGEIPCGDPCANPEPICIDNVCTACSSDQQCGDDICCDGQCLSGVCCEAGDCPQETCHTRACQDNDCIYTPILGGTGPGCSSTCCQDVEGEPFCCPAGVTSCTPAGRCQFCTNHGHCGANQICCDGACIADTLCCNGDASTCPDPGACQERACNASGACAPEPVQDGTRCGSGLCCGGTCTTPAWAHQGNIGTEGSGANQFFFPLGLGSVPGQSPVQTLWVADSANFRMSVWAGSGTTWSNQGTFGADTLSYPTGVAVAPDGQTLWIAERFGNRVSVWTKSGSTWSRQTTFGSQGSGAGQFQDPVDVAVSADGQTAWVADENNHRISIWAKSGSTWTHQDAFGSEGSGPGQFDWPSKLILSANEQTIYVSDRLNNRISIWTKSGSTWSNQGTFGSGQLGAPRGIRLSPDEQTMWIAEATPPRVSVWTRSGSTWTRQTTFGSGGEGPDQFQFAAGLVVDPDEQTVWVSDTNNSRISIWGAVCPAP